jgi:hypothetical protein
MKYLSSTNMYTYPYAALGVFFIKNTTNQSITTAISFGGSCYLEGAAALVATPNVNNETLVWQNIYAHSSSSSNFTGASTFTVPANKTIALIIYTSSYYYTNTNSFYAQFLHCYVHGFRYTTLTSGLEIDVEKTLKAWQCKGLSNTYDLWGQE